MTELFRIVYEDCSIFLGGNLIDSKWNQINKPIKSLIYKFGNKTIYMAGYQEYNHLITRQNIINTQQRRISGIFLMGNNKNKIQIIEINLIKNEIITYERIKGKEYNNALTSGWKIGIINQISQFNIL
jgi:hypothetical protein